jgi:hypothetical protein
MAKIITDKELLKVLGGIMSATDDRQTYSRLLEDLATVAADYTGCEVGTVSPPDDIVAAWTVGIRAGDDPLPEFWAKYDKDGEL